MLLDYDFLRKYTIVYKLNKDAISDVSSLVLINVTIALQASWVSIVSLYRHTDFCYP